MQNQKEILIKKLRLKRYLKVGLGIYLLIALAHVLYFFSKFGAFQYSWKKLIWDSLQFSQILFVFWGPGLSLLFFFNNALLEGISSRIKYLGTIAASVVGCSALSALGFQCLVKIDKIIFPDKLNLSSTESDTYFLKLMFVAIPILIAIVCLLLGIISLAFIKVNKIELPEDY